MDKKNFLLISVMMMSIVGLALADFTPTISQGVLNANEKDIDLVGSIYGDIIAKVHYSYTKNQWVVGFYDERGKELPAPNKWRYLSDDALLSDAQLYILIDNVLNTEIIPNEAGRLRLEYGMDDDTPTNYPSKRLERSFDTLK